MIQVKIYLFTVTNKVEKLADHATIGRGNPIWVSCGTKELNSLKQNKTKPLKLWYKKLKVTEVQK